MYGDGRLAERGTPQMSTTLWCFWGPVLCEGQERRHRSARSFGGMVNAVRPRLWFERWSQFVRRRVWRPRVSTAEGECLHAADRDAGGAVWQGVMG